MASRRGKRKGKSNHSAQAVNENRNQRIKVSTFRLIVLCMHGNAVNGVADHFNGRRRVRKILLDQVCMVLLLTNFVRLEPGFTTVVRCLQALLREQVCEQIS